MAQYYTRRHCSKLVQCHLFSASLWVPLASYSPSVSHRFLGHGVFDEPLSDIDDFAKAIDSAFEGGAAVLHRMRLSCTFQDRSGTQIGTDFEGQCIFFSAKPVINC